MAFAVHKCRLWLPRHPNRLHSWHRLVLLLGTMRALDGVVPSLGIGTGGPENGAGMSWYTPLDPGVGTR